MRNIPSVRRNSAIAVEMRTFQGIRPSIVRNMRTKLTIVPKLNRVSAIARAVRLLTVNS